MAARFTADPKLWVELQGRAGRWLIHYNPHTYPGRFAVVDADDNPIYASKSEITACSTEASYWIDGYLHGAEPEASRMFGEGIWDSTDPDPRWEQWRDALDEFHATGVWDTSRDYEEPDAR
ncbi:hypothetical protein [Jatrophihabitans sp.]|uniref:hypothetical protein n=1 Tax=Jatrophihabitans sp. TaxID=1932789 RepID=UPI0030C6D2B8|nr:hypothetical protein [Jatrophihabitans sp.]